MPYCIQKDLNHISCPECIQYPVCPDDYYINGPTQTQKQRENSKLIGNKFKVGV